jgi:ATP-binding cassette, subfamily F, member 3
MYQVSNLSKHYADNLIFEKVNFVVNAGDRLGLVGPNGCGKTTLLRILAGEEEPDEGSVHWTAPNVSLGYLPQALTYADEATVRDVLGDATEMNEDALADQLQQLAERLAHAPEADHVGLERAYATIMERLSQATAALPEYLVERILAGLGLDDVHPATLVRILSGGQKTRLGLARLLLQNPPLLLLDEPTNHLDISALEWLEDYLRQYKGAMLIVSHDRTFLDRTVTRILELDPLTHTLKAYEGNYTDYVQTKEREREKHWQAYKEQQERIGRLEDAVNDLKGQARKVEKETVAFYYRKIAKKVARQAVVRQKRLERLIESEDYVEKPSLTWKMKLEFVNTPPSGQDVLTLEGLGKRFGEHVLFEGVNLILKKGERIALVGPNGAGKTTLLRMIIAQEPANSGTLQLGANVHVGYFSQEQENLDWDATPFETVRRAAALTETEARTFLHYFLFAGDDVFVRVGSLSFGERARLALGVLVLRGCNLLLLDEPINHLDIPSRENFERALVSYEGTVLAVVHDRYFIERYATGIWAIQQRTMRRYIDLADLRRGSEEQDGTEPMILA